mgnify:CR=1 FL=1
MDRSLFILFLFGILILNVQAQNFGGGGILGISTSQVGGDNLGGFNKAGIIIGVFANKKISPLLGFQAEMIYIEKGSNNPEMMKDGIQDISSSYIEIPLLLQYNQSNTLKIEGGIQTGYLIDGYYNDLNGKMDNEINPFIDYDINVLLGMDYKISTNISLNTRISNSIIPIGKEDKNSNTYNSFLKGKYNSVLSFTLHYNF